jgi:hypothetical protein
MLLSNGGMAGLFYGPGFRVRRPIPERPARDGRRASGKLGAAPSNLNAHRDTESGVRLGCQLGHGRAAAARRTATRSVAGPGTVVANLNHDSESSGQAPAGSTPRPGVPGAGRGPSPGHPGAPSRPRRRGCALVRGERARERARGAGGERERERARARVRVRGRRAAFRVPGQA